MVPTSTARLASTCRRYLSGGCLLAGVVVPAAFSAGALVPLPNAVFKANITALPNGTGGVQNSYELPVPASISADKQFALVPYLEDSASVVAETFGGLAPVATLQGNTHGSAFTAPASQSARAFGSVSIRYSAQVVETSPPPVPQFSIPVIIKARATVQATGGASPAPGESYSYGSDVSASVQVSSYASGFAHAALRSDGGTTLPPSDSFNFSTLADIPVGNELSVSIIVQASCSSGSGGISSAFAEFDAMADPEFIIDPTFTYKDYYAVAYSPNLLPEPNMAMAFPLMLLLHRRRRTPDSTPASLPKARPTPCTRFDRRAIATLLLAGIARPAVAANLQPSSYAATPGQGIAQSGSTNYFDETGNQLTDGVLGGDNILADLGNGMAYEWVAWRNVEPTITFQFHTPVHLDMVSIDFNRADGSSIKIPPLVNIGGVPFTPPLTAIPNLHRGWVDFPVDLTTSALNVTMADSSAVVWVFVDEFKFEGTSVPEPGTLSITAVVPLLTLLRRRNRRQFALPCQSERVRRVFHPDTSGS